MEPPGLDAWRPLSVARVAVLFKDAPFRWWISGGHALELHVGRSWREHGDTDVGVLRSDASRCCDWLSEWDSWIASRGKLSRFNGDTLTEDAGENNIWVRQPGDIFWAFDLTLGAGNSDEWAYRRDPRIRRPWDEAILRTVDGVPYLAPELQLLFKSTSYRPKDDQDAKEVIPCLTERQLTFLTSRLEYDHPWLGIMYA